MLLQILIMLLVCSLSFAGEEKSDFKKEDNNTASYTVTITQEPIVKNIVMTLNDAKREKTALEADKARWQGEVDKVQKKIDDIDAFIKFCEENGIKEN